MEKLDANRKAINEYVNRNAVYLERFSGVPIHTERDMEIARKEAISRLQGMFDEDVQKMCERLYNCSCVALYEYVIEGKDGTEERDYTEEDYTLLKVRKEDLDHIRYVLGRVGIYVEVEGN